MLAGANIHALQQSLGNFSAGIKSVAAVLPVSLRLWYPWCPLNVQTIQHWQQRIALSDLKQTFHFSLNDHGG
jgi:hypothetical protein